MADLAGGATRRRRERRLRSWLRHERMTVRMELAAALHHSAGPVTNDAVRSQKTVSSRGVRPGVLQDPAPQLVSEHAACPCSSGVPSLSLPVLADRAAEAVDSSSLRFLTASALEARREEEEEQEQEKVVEELDVHMRIPWNQLTPDQRAVTSRPGAFQAWKAWSAARAAGRRRKKRKKKKLPKTSSHSSSGRARRRQRQRHARTRAVFPSFVGKPVLPCFVAGMDQNDSFLRDSCARRLHRQWQVQGWYCWFCTPLVVFPLVVAWPQMLMRVPCRPRR